MSEAHLTHRLRRMTGRDPMEYAWWLASRLSLLSEHVSDDAATEHAEERTAYARLLLGLVQRSGAGSPAVPMVKASSLAPRIERILRESPPPRVQRRSR